MLSACGSKRAQQVSLYDHGLEVVHIMGEMARSQSYAEAVTGNGEVRAILQTIGSGDYREPKQVYSIAIDREELFSLADLGDPSTMSQELRAFLGRRMFGAVTSQVNGMSGAENLAAVSVCAAGKVFVSEEAQEELIYLYTFDDGIPAAVTFTLGEDHGVEANGMFMMSDEFVCGSADEIQQFFHEMGVAAQVEVLVSEDG